MKPQIVFIQPVFCPCDSVFQLNKNSLSSLLEYLKESRYRIDIILGGWAINDFYWDEIFKIVDELKKLELGVVEITRFKHNYGKSYIVNKLHNKYYKNNKTVKFIFTVDSDIQFDLEEPYMFDRMLFAANKLEMENNRPFGCLTLNLKPNQHNDFVYKDKCVEFNCFGDKKEELRWDSIYQGGFAGGALFISTKAWKKIGGYKMYSQTYAPEDAFLFMSLNALNYSFAIFKTLYVIHPANVSEEYTAWKKFVMNRGYIIFDKFDKNKFMANVKESEKFWKEFKK
jgi:hypothetical protein